MASRDFSTQVYGYLKKGGLTNKADPLRGIVAKLLALPATKAGGEAYYVNDFRDKLKSAIEQLMKDRGMSKASAKTTLQKIIRRVLPKGDYRLGILRGKSVAPIAAAAVRSVTSTTKVGPEINVVRRGGPLVAPTRRKVVESVIKGPTAPVVGAPTAGAVASAKDLGKLGKIKQAFGKGGKLAGGLTGLFAVLAVNELLNVVLEDKRANRQIDVQEGAMSPESEYYRQMQPLLQQDYAASQAQMLQAFGGGAGGGLLSVTGETVIGGGR